MPLFLICAELLKDRAVRAEKAGTPPLTPNSIVFLYAHQHHFDSPFPGILPLVNETGTGLVERRLGRGPIRAGLEFHGVGGPIFVKMGSELPCHGHGVDPETNVLFADTPVPPYDYAVHILFAKPCSMMFVSTHRRIAADDLLRHLAQPQHGLENALLDLLQIYILRRLRQSAF